MRDVFIAGVGMTPFGVHADKTTGDLSREAATNALRDAGADPSQLDAVFFANTSQGGLEGQHGIRGQHALRPLGIEGAPLWNIENACVGSSSALNLAFGQIAGGLADVVLVVGAEKLHSPDRERRLAIFAQPDDLHQVRAFVAANEAEIAGIGPEVPTDGARSIFMDFYALNTKLHMKRYGTTMEHLAIVSAKNHHASTMNPLAHYQKDFTVAEVLASRMVSWPLTLPMCAPVTDGASAAVICSREGLDRLRAASPVRILASAMCGGVIRAIDDVERAATRRAAKLAFAQAGLGPQDIHVAEVHDASAFGEINQVELTGLCAIGEGGAFAADGASAIGGRLPVNPSGGLQSKGHPIAASGLAQIHELVLQLRGDAAGRQTPNARHALASCSGGFYGVEEAAACVTILAA